MRSEALQIHKPEISVKFLSSENNSPLAKLRRRRWQELKDNKNGELTAVWFCDDARLLASFALGTFDILPIRSIAAAGDPEPFRYMLDHQSVGQGMVLGHYNSDLQQPGKPMRGCGGLEGKRRREHITEAADADVAHGYIDRHIEHSDVVVQTLKSAWKAAQVSKTGKPILAAIWDHVTYQIIPVGFFEQNGRTYTGIIPFNELRKTQVKGITPEELVQISREILPDKLRKLLINNEQLTTTYTSSPIFKQFKESQKIQNPPAVMITTSSVPLGAQFPDLAQPNMVFKVLLPLERTENYDEDGSFSFDPKEVKKIIAQAHYPIAHALSAKPGEDFYDTTTLIVETPNMEATKYLAGELKKRAWFKEWIRKKNGKLILIEMRQGEVKHITDTLT